MSKVSKMKLEEIFQETDAIFSDLDVLYFCEDEEVTKGFLTLYQKESNNFQKLKQYLIEHQDKINKEKLVLLLYLKYRENLDAIRKEIELLETSNGHIQQLYKLKQEEKIQSKNMERTKRLGKNIDKYLLECEYSNNRIDIKIESSKEIFNNIKFQEKKKLKRIKEIDDDIGTQGDGLIYIIQSLMVSDLTALLPTPELGRGMRELLLNNCLLKAKKISYEELNKLKNDNFDVYCDMVDGVEPNDYLEEFREEIIKNIRFIDIDKLLLMAGYRLEEALENKAYSEQEIPIVKGLLIFINDRIKNKRIKVNDVLQKRGTYEDEEVTYTYEDLQKLIHRFIGEDYIRQKDLQQAKVDLLNGDVTLDDMETLVFNLIELNEKEIEQMMPYGMENFVYGIRKLQYSEFKIIEKLSQYPALVSVDLLSYLYNSSDITISTIKQLYNNKVINSEFFKEFSEEIDLSSEINIQKINERYLQIKESEVPDEEQISDLDTIIEFYKIINLEDKSAEELAEESNDVMYKLAEDFEGEEDLLFYYEKGLLTLETVADWSGERLINRLYEEGKIDLKDLIQLYKNGKINQTLLQNRVLETELDYTELLKNIYLGYISEEKIIDLYMQGKIFDTDLKVIASQKKISLKRYYQATQERTKEVLEENSQIKFETELVNIPNKSDINIHLIEEEEEKNKDISTNFNKKAKTLIDPNVRYELLQAIGAKKANAIIPDENNSFYHYEFFVIPDENGELQTNSVVIAERFYEDKEKQDKFATDNATYFFQYKDLMVNSNLKKNEMTKDRNNIVFKSHHRSGNWAASVLYGITKTMLSSDLSEYSKENQRKIVIEKLAREYGDSKLMEILDVAGKVDSGEYTYEEVNSSYSKKEKSIEEANDGEVDDGER